jgi:hypothetical protein
MLQETAIISNLFVSFQFEFPQNILFFSKITAAIQLHILD